MKRAIIIICVLFAQAALGQGNYEAAMQKGMDLLRSAKSFAQYQEASNHFERVALVEKEKWQPAYWAAYSTMITAMNAESDDAKDEWYDKAASLAKKLEGSSIEKSEYYTLRGYIALMKIAVSPMIRSAMGTSDAMEWLEKAKKENSNNPRPYYVQAQHLFYTPEFFGGGKKVCKPILEKALANDQKESESKNFEPRWGRGRTESLLKECNQ
jgi:hypothetical protein